MIYDQRGVAMGKGPHCSASHTAPKLPMPRQKWQSALSTCSSCTSGNQMNTFLDDLLSLKNLNHKNPVPKCAPQLCSFLCHASVLMILTENITPVDPLFNLLLDLGAVRSRCLESLGFQKALRAGSVTKRLLDATSAATDGQNSLMKSV